MKFKDVKNNIQYVCYNPLNDRIGLWTKHFIKNRLMYGCSINKYGIFLKKIDNYKKDTLIVLGEL